jgi:ATP-dependent DNA helicase RecG
MAPFENQHRDPDATPKTLVKTPVKTPDLVLQLLSEHPEMTLTEIAETIGKSLSAVERASAKLVKAGLLKYVGPKKRWILGG